MKPFILHRPSPVVTYPIICLIGAAAGAAIIFGLNALESLFR
jgi:hypothetical protein